MILRKNENMQVNLKTICFIDNHPISVKLACSLNTFSINGVFDYLPPAGFAVHHFLLRSSELGRLHKCFYGNRYGDGPAENKNAAQNITHAFYVYFLFL